MAKKIQMATTCTTDIANEEGNNMKEITMNVNEIIAEAARKADNIRMRITDRAGYVRAFKGATDSAELKAKVAPFLATVPDNVVEEGADVVLCKELVTNGMPYAYEDDMVILGWSANPEFGKERKRKNVLWVHVKPKLRPKTMADKALTFFGKKYPDMPEGIIQELFDAAWDGEEITLCVHPKAAPIVLKAKEKQGQGRYMLQEPDAKGNIIPNRPIAYVVGNRAYVSIPGTKNGRPWTFRANPAPKQG